MWREMLRFSVKVLCLTILAVGGLWWLSERGFEFSFREEREANQRVIAVLEGERDQLRLQLNAAKEEMQLLMKTGYAEASRLVTSWTEICGRLTLRNLMGDVGCGEALKKGFPDRKLKLLIYKNPEVAIQSAREFIIDRCKLVDNEPPKICIEFGAGN